MATTLRSSNPALTEKTFEQYRVQPDPTAAGWAAPPPGTVPGAPPSYTPPAASAAVMTNGGVTTATGVLLVLLVAGAVVGWNSTTINADVVQIPSWTILSIIAG